jgi:hypothetical protein
MESLISPSHLRAEENPTLFVKKLIGKSLACRKPRSSQYQPWGSVTGLYKGWVGSGSCGKVMVEKWRFDGAIGLKVNLWVTCVMSKLKWISGLMIGWVSVDSGTKMILVPSWLSKRPFWRRMVADGEAERLKISGHVRCWEASRHVHSARPCRSQCVYIHWHPTPMDNSHFCFP